MNTHVPPPPLAAIGRFFRQLTGNKELSALIADIRKRAKISVPDDLRNLDGHRQTAGMILGALDMLGGPKFQAKVLKAAEMPGGAGDWSNSLKATVRAYARIQRALLTTTDKEKILGLVQIRVPIAAREA